MRRNEFSTKNNLSTPIEESLTNPSKELKNHIWNGICEFLILHPKQNVRYLAYPGIVRLLADFFHMNILYLKVGKFLILFIMYQKELQIRKLYLIVKAY